ncbi:hypothetical protein QBC37DRAFT_435865 [Rhypophila decipiens]|uniref:Gag protein n=1 Tax=Rhypophila decipiens TaxID=261697 RepID=A0AAN6XS23_9PEZI|nr:hypothetical protein QBC37DRAFT_435865 [Rhypophila decipiens]
MVSQSIGDTFTTVLKGPSDWETWSNAILKKASQLEALDLLLGNESFMPKPRLPSLADHAKGNNTTAGTNNAENITRGPALNTRSRRENITQDSTQTLDGSNQSVANSPPPTETTSTAITMTDLDAEGKESLKYAERQYDRLFANYRAQIRAKDTINDFIEKTVAPHYKDTCCKYDMTITEMYQALKEQVGVSTNRANFLAREAYRAALKPPTKNAKELEKWVEQWEKAIAAAQSKNIAEATSTDTWFADFLDAVDSVASGWVTAYRMANQTAVNNNKITFRTVGNDFRDEVRRILRSQVGSHPRIAKGTFGPTFNGKNGDYIPHADQENNKKRRNNSNEGWDASKKAKVPPSGRQERPGDGPSHDERLTRKPCPICGLLHALKRCFYAFPEKAWSGWTPNPDVQEIAKKNLMVPKFGEQVEAIKQAETAEKNTD